jgi:maleate isomerase
LIVFNCTTGSLIKGIGYDREITKRIEDRVGIPAMTTSTAVIEGLNFLGAKKIAIATPYTQELNNREKQFMEDNGFVIPVIETIEKPDVIEIKTPHMQYINAEEMYALARKIYSFEVDAMFLSCTGLGLIDIIDTLENDLQVPVITSNQVTMWAALRKIGINERMHGLGQLFLQ